MYNGYASREEFYRALDQLSIGYVVERERRLRENPEGLRHEGCDHAYGICSG
jgi:hypothetical protein